MHINKWQTQATPNINTAMRMIGRLFREQLNKPCAKRKKGKIRLKRWIKNSNIQSVEEYCSREAQTENVDSRPFIPGFSDLTWDPLRDGSHVSPLWCPNATLEIEKPGRSGSPTFLGFPSISYASQMLCSLPSCHSLTIWVLRKLHSKAVDLKPPFKVSYPILRILNFNKIDRCERSTLLLYLLSFWRRCRFFHTFFWSLKTITH